MLAELSIRDVVLIDRLDLSFEPGLTVLTGETGAGKSILLDALGLALGARADSALVRDGAEVASVTAVFDPPAGHPSRGILAEHDIADHGPILLRRRLACDGGSRAYVNDRPATIGLLRRLGEALVEVQGQFEPRGLIDPASHRTMVDAYGRLGEQAGAVAAAWNAWRAAEDARAEAEEQLARARADENFLRHAVSELDAIDPQTEEEETLASTRALLQNREKIIIALNAARNEIGEEADIEGRVQAARAALDRVAGLAGGVLDDALAALERAAAECAEAAAAIDAAGRDLDLDQGELEKVEERLFALRDLARKHRVTVAELPTLRAELARRLDLVEHSGEELDRLGKQARAGRNDYEKAAQALHLARVDAAQALDHAVSDELPPLKLGKARFVTEIESRPEHEWSPNGIDRVAFTVAANPGARPGPLGKVASGGELSRLMLALRVVLSGTGSAPVLVFDEVDSGVGGATAAAVGERLAQLSDRFQVLVVTHSPQVAARGRHHFRVEKDTDDVRALTHVASLDNEARREEIARMLAGKSITAEARAAAASLLNGDAP